jgi:hypothetical protein
MADLLVIRALELLGAKACSPTEPVDDGLPMELKLAPVDACSTMDLRERAVVTETGLDAQGSLVAVRIEGSVVGPFWFCLSDTEPFDPGDGIPVYRPSEIKALVGKGYGPKDLQAVHRVKLLMEGRVVH